MTEFARAEFARRSCQVYTDMKSLAFPEQVYLEIEKMEELAYIEDGLVLLDELQIGLASKNWQSVPDEALKAMAQFRKNALDVLYTTQHPDRVLKVMRENTHNWVRCRKAGPVIVQTWKTALNEKRGKIKIIPIRSSVYGLYDTYEVLGKRPSRALARSTYLESLRRARSEAGAKPRGADPFKVPIWHVTADGEHRLTVLARDVLGVLKDRGIVQNGNPHMWEWVAAEVRRRVWLASFGLTAADVAEACTIEHPWAYAGCYCHRSDPDSVDLVPWSVATMPETSTGKRWAIAGRQFSAGPQGVAAAWEWASEALADRLGKFQIKGAS